jgi:DNA repair ATPase RecN
VARRKKAAAQDAPHPKQASPARSEGTLPELRDEIAQLRACAELLAGALKDVPKADDFQPLADHLYEFAQTMPRLLKSLQGLPAAVGPLEDAVRALEHVLVTLPRAEDYEPLVEPLREFTRVAPALAEQLAVVMKSVAPLSDVVGQLRKTADTFHSAPARPAGDGALLEAAAERMTEAQQAIREALDSLPRDREYRRVAEQLKAIASVSPSLTEWLHEVPKLSMPLGESIASLERAAESLAEGESELRAQSGGAAHAQRESAGPRTVSVGGRPATASSKGRKPR